MYHFGDYRVLGLAGCCLVFGNGCCGCYDYCHHYDYCYRYGGRHRVDKACLVSTVVAATVAVTAIVTVTAIGMMPTFVAVPPRDTTIECHTADENRHDARHP